jgi:glucose-1-phosphate adenylyltransferase
MNDVLTIVLGGGRGTRLFPLTHLRSKPAVPIGGKYRLIDVPISNCLHAGLKRIYVLTQFNSASLNRHIAQTYRMDLFSGGFVEVLAAEQTPEGEMWFQGTADAVRQAARHFRDVEAEYYLVLAGDHVYRIDFAELIETHIERDADITIAAQPVSAEDATQMGIFRFDASGHIAGFEEKPRAERLTQMGSSAPTHSPAGLLTADKPFVASMGIYVFSREVLYDILARDRAVDFGREIIPHALGTHRVHTHLYRGFWADVGTVSSFYDVNLMLTRRGAPFSFFHPTRPIYTRPRFLPAARVRVPHRRSPHRRRRVPRHLRSRSIGRRHPHVDPPRDEGFALGAARSGLLRGSHRRLAARHRPQRRARSGDRGQERANRRWRAARQRARHPGRRRRRLLHPKRHHRRAQGRGREAGDGGLI